MNPIPNFTALPGLIPALEAAGIDITATNDASGNQTWWSSNVAAAQTIASTYDGTAWAKSNPSGTGKLDQLEAFAASYFNINGWAHAGVATNITGGQVSAFIAMSVNNYRTLRASIIAATTVAAVQAININSGWPPNQ